MRRALQIAFLAAAVAGAADAPRTRVVPPLPAPGATPGVGRCTSDGACTVTDDATGRTRAASRLTLAR